MSTSQVLLVGAQSSLLPNGTTATTQPQGDNSTKVATTAYVDAAISTSGIAGFFAAPNIFGEAPTQNGAGWNGGFFSLFYLPKPIVITQCSVNVVAVSASASKQLGLGIYPGSAGSTLLASATFNVSTGQATGVRSSVISQASVRLPVGYYYSVTTCNDATVSLTYFNSPALLALNVMNQNGTRFGTVTVAVQGTPDNTLGTLSKSTSGVGGVAMFFEP